MRPVLLGNGPDEAEISCAHATPTSNVHPRQGRCLERSDVAAVVGPSCGTCVASVLACVCSTTVSTVCALSLEAVTLLTVHVPTVPPTCLTNTLRESTVPRHTVPVPRHRFVSSELESRSLSRLPAI